MEQLLSITRGAQNKIIGSSTSFICNSASLYFKVIPGHKGGLNSSKNTGRSGKVYL